MNNNKKDSSEHISAFLTADELYSIEKLLDRKANDFELNMYAAMWSEHISYKSSIRWIESFPKSGKHILVPAGEENAGVVDLDDDLACVVKMESHNHPTAKNPGEAAVGVGNVFRDLIAMGARPIAHLNILRFGNLTNEKTKTSVRKVISALGSYSNNFGVPVVGGEILFDDSYSHNPLLNMMAVGLVKKDKIITASLKDNNDLLYLIGRKTSGSGFHGAGFASSPFRETMEHLIPETQMADPHSGKILHDCLMELNERSLIKGMQDIGAGGVLCAAAEMAFRGEKGVEIRIDSIPVSKTDLDPVEILLSQSQEQMLLSVSKQEKATVDEIVEKWDLSYAVVGSVTNNGSIKVKWEDDILGELPVSTLVKGGGAPVYIRKFEESGRKVVKITADEVPFPDLKEVAKSLIRNQNVASRRSIYEQFDTMAGLSNVGSDYAGDAGVVHIPEQKKLLALSVDGNSRYVRMEPRNGAMIAVAEAARNIVCSGGVPLAMADGLNFGDPADSHVYHDFVESVKGIRKMSDLMGIPILAGNVSFNNLTKEKDRTISVQPTPIIGMLGVIEDKSNMMSISFRNKGDMIYIIGNSDNDISGSEYLSAMHLIDKTAAPTMDPEKEIKLQAIIAKLIAEKYISSAHDVSLGGLFVALVECCLPNNLGFDITSSAEVREDAFLFGESQSRVVVSVSPDRETSFLDFMMEQDFPFSALGHVTKQELRIDDSSFGFITDYSRDFENALGEILEEE